MIDQSLLDFLEAENPMSRAWQDAAFQVVNSIVAFLEKKSEEQPYLRPAWRVAFLLYMNVIHSKTYIGCSFEEFAGILEVLNPLVRTAIGTQPVGSA